MLYTVPAGDRDPERCRVRMDGDDRTKSVAVKYLRAVERKHPSPGEITAAPDYASSATAPVPKGGAIRSERYLEWIRRQPCAWSGSVVGVEASHHVPKGQGRMGKKTCDTNALPLCASVHRRYHAEGVVGGMTPEQSEAWVLQEIASHLGRFLVELGAGRIE